MQRLLPSAPVQGLLVGTSHSSFGTIVARIAQPALGHRQRDKSEPHSAVPRLGGMWFRALAKTRAACSNRIQFWAVSRPARASVNRIPTGGSVCRPHAVAGMATVKIQSVGNVVPLGRVLCLQRPYAKIFIDIWCDNRCLPACAGLRWA